MRNELIDLAQAAGEIALSYFSGEREVSVEEKGHLDLVTLADRGVERFIVDALRRRFPDDGIVGEEGAAINRNAARQWVIDPIDGTFNFVRKMDQWAVSIGLFENGRPVFGVIHAPVRRETLSGGGDMEVLLNARPLPALSPLDPARGVISIGFSTDTSWEVEQEVIRFITRDLKMSYRNCGSTTAAFLMLAAGQVDANLGCGVRSWDVMAGLALIEGLGGSDSVNWRSTGLDTQFSYVSGCPDVVERTRGLLDRIQMSNIVKASAG